MVSGSIHATHPRTRGGSFPAKLGLSLLATAIFVVVLLAVWSLHSRLLPVAVVLFSALADVAVAVLVAGALLLLPFARRVLEPFERVLLVVIWLLGGYAFAVSIPTVLDRSLSFYILEKLQQRGGGISEDAIGDVFVREYLPEFRLVDVRLTEQVEAGTVVIRDGCVVLTERGDRLASFSRFFRLNLQPRRRLLADEYTDALVDPFHGSATGRMGYECGPGGTGLQG